MKIFERRAGPKLGMIDPNVLDLHLLPSIEQINIEVIEQGATGCHIYLLSNLISQICSQKGSEFFVPTKIPNIDYSFLSIFSFIGLLDGSVASFWYSDLDQMFPEISLVTGLEKAALDIGVHGLSFSFFFLLVLSIVRANKSFFEVNTKEVLKSVKQNLFPVAFGELSFWLPAYTIGFSLAPDTFTDVLWFAETVRLALWAQCFFNKKSDKLENARVQRNQFK